MGTEQEITVQAAGLFDSGNNPYALPPGALLVANDVEITRDNVIQGRRGMAQKTTVRFIRFANFGSTVIGVDILGSSIYRSTSPYTVWTPTTAGINAAFRPVEAASGLFLQGSLSGPVGGGTTGVVRMDSTSSTPVMAGMTAGRGLSAAIGAAGSAVKGQTKVAYRVVYGRRLSTGRLILGAPSNRVVLSNTNASTTTNDVTLTVVLPFGPRGLTSGDFVQVYRTSGTVDLAATTDPGDECYLVLEASVPAPATITGFARVGTVVTATTGSAHGFATNQTVYVATSTTNFASGPKVVTDTPSATQFTYTEAGAATTSGVVTVAVYPVTISLTDSQPDGTGGASLYTNPSQETILNQNAVPPGSLSGACEWFGNCLWIGSPFLQSRATLTMLSVPTAGSVLTFAGQVYSAGAAEDVQSATFQRFTSGTPFENIRSTAYSFARVFNLLNSWAGEYAQVLDDSTTPGNITVVDEAGNTFAFSIAQPASIIASGRSSLAAPWYLNGVAYSKPSQPDHFSQAIATAPPRVGSDAELVKAVVATRSALFIFKNDGVWKATGSDGNFSIQPLDPTTSILAAESAVALDNNVYLLTDQGFARVSESGVEIISRPIEQIVRDNFTSATIACASEGDHKYRAWCGTTCVVYDPWTKAWTTRSEPFLDSTVSAVINERTTGRLLVSGTSTVGARSGTYLENLTALGDSLGETVTVSTADQATTQNSYNITHTAASLVVGDTVDFTTGQFEVIQATDSTHSIVMATTMPIAGTFPLYRKTGTRQVAWQIRPSRPGTLNEWQELVFQFLANVGIRASVNLATDFVTSGATNIDLDLVQTRLTNGDGFNQVRVWPAREDSLSAVLVATLSWGSSLADIRLAGLTTRFVPSSWQVSR